jgi:predicted phosphodiesterase
MDLLLSRRHVKAWIYGHSHAWEVKEQDGLHLVNLPPVAYIFQPERPNGWVELELGESAATLQLRTLDPQHALAGQTVELAWRA